MAALLAIEDLRIWFAERPVVRRVSLAIEPGEVLGLVGESGSGKSVTSLAVLGLLGAAARVEGSICWQGRELLRSADRTMRAIRGREIRRRVVGALEEVAIPDAAGRFGDYPHQFSGGQRQRILIAMALVHKPQLLIADEPTTALDVTVQAQVLELLKTLQREHGLAMLFTSHDLAVVGQVADRVAVMRHGEVLESGPARQVLIAPRHAYTQSLLAAVPTLRTDRDKPLAMIEAH